VTLYLPFRQARWYTQTTGRNTRVVVLHTTEGGGTAASNQAMFAVWDRVVSAHYLVGTDGVAPCVRIKDVAYAAPGANRDGIQIEQIGRAAWSRTDWLNDHTVELEHVAQLLADICVDCDIPAVFLDAAAVRRGERGITTHVQITQAYPDQGSGHWDPGPGYPIDVVMARVVELLHPEPPPIPTEDDDMARPYTAVRPVNGYPVVMLGPDGTFYVLEPKRVDDLVAAKLVNGIEPGQAFDAYANRLDWDTFAWKYNAILQRDRGRGLDAEDRRPAGEV